MPNPYIRLDEGQYFVGRIERIGELDSLFPDVRSTAPSVIVTIEESNKTFLVPGRSFRFTFFNPTLMRQWSATPGNVGECIYVMHNPASKEGVRWSYDVLRMD